MMLPKKSSLTKEELEEAAWLKRRPTLDESRRMLRDALQGAFRISIVGGAIQSDQWRTGSYGVLLGFVKREIFDLENLSLDERRGLIYLCALLAAKANGTESLEDVRSMLDAAWGFYVKVEPTRADSWRDIPLADLFDHAKHEVEEVVRGETLERRLHNALDLTALAAIIYLRSLP